MKDEKDQREIVIRDIAREIVEDASTLPMDDVERLNLEQLMRASKSPRTWKSYQADWRAFEAWCWRKSIKQPLGISPENLARYIAYMASEEKRKYATIRRRITAIAQVHKHFDRLPPTTMPIVTRALAGARRILGVKQDKKKPFRVEMLRDAIPKIPNDTREGCLRRAVLTVGFFGAFRRTELVGLDVEDLEFVPDGVRITIRHSKTDQESEGRVIALPRMRPVCPVAALEKWLQISEIKSGALFRTINRWGGVKSYRLPPAYVADFVKDAAHSIGVDADDFGGHSLRSGLITTVAGKASIHKIKEMSGHKSDRELSGYIRDERLFDDNVARVASSILRKKSKRKK